MFLRVLILFIAFSNTSSVSAINLLERCKVFSIYDGDTLTAFCNKKKVKVRFNCIDTPEMKQKPWGQISRNYLRQITPKFVDLRVFTKDRYGRYVADVLVGTENLNLKMVSDGYAAVYKKYCKADIFFAAESVAKKNLKGIWQKEGLHQSPWVWRKLKRVK